MELKVYTTSQELQKDIQELKRQRNSIAFVPTMGALHRGHQTLIEEGKAIADICVASIFVNPTQFNDKKDYQIYPRTIEEDKKKLIEAGCDILFYPSEKEMYENPDLDIEPIDIGYLDSIMEGKKRPGHYTGVVTIVEKLLLSVNPDFLIMGLKDYQQVMVIRKLLDERNMNQIELIGVDTVREESGLAMSSRNARLSPEGKKTASQIHKALNYIASQKGQDTMKEAIDEAKRKYLDTNYFEVEYVEIYSQKDLQPIHEIEWKLDIPMVVLIAAWLEDVRLIDNLEF